MSPERASAAIVRIVREVRKTSNNWLVPPGYKQGYWLGGGPWLAEYGFTHRFFIQQALSISRNLAPEVKAKIADAPKRLASMAHLYELSQLAPDQQRTILQRIHQEGLTREEIRGAAVGAKQEAKEDRGNRRGRPTQRKPYTKTFRTDNGASVLVRFRKARVSVEEVREALQEVLRLLAA